MGVGLTQAETAVILLASPSATVTYVMASEMGGEPELAAAAVTISTIISIVTYTLWIAVMGG
jgi:predicted permease